MNQLEKDLKDSMIPDFCVIRNVPDEQLEEFKQSHPARNYLHVQRVGP